MEQATRNPTSMYFPHGGTGSRYWNPRSLALPPNSSDIITAGQQAGHAMAQTKRAAMRDGQLSPAANKKSKHGSSPCNTVGCVMQQCAPLSVHLQLGSDGAGQIPTADTRNLATADAFPPPSTKRASILINKSIAGKFAAPAPSTTANAATVAKDNAASSSCAPSTSKAAPSTSKAKPSTSKSKPSTSKAKPSTGRVAPPTSGKCGPSTSKGGLSAAVHTEEKTAKTYSFEQKALALDGFTQASKAAAAPAQLQLLQELCEGNMNPDHFNKLLAFIRDSHHFYGVNKVPLEHAIEHASERADDDDEEVVDEDEDDGEEGGEIGGEDGGVSDGNDGGGGVADVTAADAESADEITKMCDDAGV